MTASPIENFKLPELTWLNDVFSKVKTALDDLKTKVNEFFKSSFGFELFEAKKETKQELNNLSYETHLANILDSLKAYWFDESLISDYQTKLGNFLKEPTNASATDQLIKDFKEIVGNLKSEDKDIIKAIHDKELSDFKDSPLSAFEIVAVARKHKVPVSYILSFIRNDSAYWTTWKWKETNNPGNVGNMDDGSTKIFTTWYQGIDAVGKNLAWRIAQYKNIYGDKLPKISELAENKGPDNKGFLDNQWNYKQDNTEKKWAYMTSENWGEAVEKLLTNMDTGITSKNEQYIA